ncbi:MAG TPA: hypothetical protein DD738_12010 [Ruminiclostridium sp.]|nr:hypothetical protein [Ruminiclostridium sp.]
MVFISVKRKTLGFVALIVILCLVAVSIYSILKIAENENKYQSILVMARMFQDTDFIAYISDQEAKAEKPVIEVFDISKGEVISKTSVNIEIQNEVFHYIKAVKTLYTKVIPFPSKGYIIRVPFEKPMNVKIKLLNDVGIKTLDSAFIILSEKEAPLLLVLDDQHRPYFYTFNASVQPLLDYVKLEIPEKSADEQTGGEPETPGEGSGS